MTNTKHLRSSPFTLGGCHVSDKQLADFADALETVRVNVRTIKLPAAKRENNHGINACVLPLHGIAVRSLNSSSWFVPRRTMVYGIGKIKAAMQYVDLGINALIGPATPLDFRSAIEATRAVLSGPTGHFERVPILSVVEIAAQGRTWTGITKNVGTGGMALRLIRSGPLPQEVTLKFVLPYSGLFSVKASPRWYSGRIVGLRFHDPDSVRSLRDWLLQYSSLGSGDTS